MSVPRLLAQVVFLGSQIVGKAFMEAARQAARNARAGRVEATSAAGSTSETSDNSTTANITRTHRMTLDEARMILNIKEPTLEHEEEMVKNYDHLFATNAPPAPKNSPPGTPGGAGSFYLQSKIVRARERIEAEWAMARKNEDEALGRNGNSNSNSDSDANPSSSQENSGAQQEKKDERS